MMVFKDFLRAVQRAEADSNEHRLNWLQNLDQSWFQCSLDILKNPDALRREAAFILTTYGNPVKCSKIDAKSICDLAGESDLLAIVTSTMTSDEFFVLISELCDKGLKLAGLLGMEDNND